MTIKQTEDKDKEFRIEKERFLSDTVLQNFNDLLIRIFSIAIPTYIISNNGIERIYNSDTQKLTDTIINHRNEYIRIIYKIPMEKYKRRF